MLLDRRMPMPVLAPDLRAANLAYNGHAIPLSSAPSSDWLVKS